MNCEGVEKYEEKGSERLQDENDVPYFGIGLLILMATQTQLFVVLATFCLLPRLCDCRMGR